MVELSKQDWAPAADANGAQKLRILLAEDTQISAEAMKAMASHFGVDLETAENGLDAIHMVEAAHAEGNPYTLLMVDVMMPILDGVETTIRLRELGFGADVLPIVAVTAATSFDEIRSYRAAGIQAFLAKPVGMKEFKAALEAWGYRTRPRASTKRLIALRDLEEQFHDRNVRTLNIIEEALTQKDISGATVKEIRHLLHQIAGTATTFGKPELSRVARIHEHELLDAVENDGSRRALLEAARIDLSTRISS